MNKNFFKKFVVSLVMTSLFLSLTYFLVSENGFKGQIAKAGLEEDMKAKLGGAGGAYGVETGSAPKKDIPAVVSLVIKTALIIIGVILLAYLVYGGFLWMTSQGNKDSLEAAHKVITNAIVGLIVIFAAYAITYFVVENLVKTTTT